MAVDLEPTTTNAPAMHHRQQPQTTVESRKKALSLNIPLAPNTTSPTTSVNTSSNSNATTSSKSDASTPSPSSSPMKKPLVFKKPTKHQFTWSELSKMVASKDLTPMGRSEAVQEAYQRAIKRRTKKYGSPDEYIRQRVLHWPPAEQDVAATPSSGAFSDGNESSTSCSSITPPSSPTGPVDPLEIALKKNEFPYSVKPGIEHWLIWSRHPLTDEVWIRRYLEERLPGRDYLFFINPPELRSVPSIFHVQVFTKGEGEVLDEEDMEVKKEVQEAAQEAAKMTRVVEK
ncbi:hypothetical protein BGZ68_006380 [Mortierella alpina]|nr:hypothetical protein BGZ68_006380 [Mortierella alpina]